MNIQSEGGGMTDNCIRDGGNIVALVPEMVLVLYEFEQSYMLFVESRFQFAL